MRSYSAELKAEVIGAWQAGSTLDQLHGAHGIPKSTLQRWVKGRVRTVRVPKKGEADFDDAVDIDRVAARHVNAGALAGEAILRKAADPGWLDRQNAADLAVLYGVIADKQLRLLAAFQRADDAGAGQRALPAGEQPAEPLGPGDAAQPEAVD